MDIDFLCRNKSKEWLPFAYRLLFPVQKMLVQAILNCGGKLLHKSHFLAEVSFISDLKWYGIHCIVPITKGLWALIEKA